MVLTFFREARVGRMVSLAPPLEDERNEKEIIEEEGEESGPGPP